MRIVELAHDLTPLAELAILEDRIPTAKEWKTWVLDGPATIEYLGKYITVPNGFMTDFASIPWVFRWWQTGSTGPQRVAAYFHDWLYSSQNVISRREADKIFRLVMKEISEPGFRNWFRRSAMWLGLRIGGIFAWWSNQKKLRELGPSWRMIN